MQPAPQPIFIHAFGDLYVEVLGKERPSQSYPMRSWMEQGLYPAASSDAPVCDTSTMINLYTMVTRKTESGQVLGADQALSMTEAVSALTFNGAYLSFDESRKGTLEPGMLADLAVLDRDLFAVDEEEIQDIKVDLTLLDGAVVYDRTEGAA